MSGQIVSEEVRESTDIFASELALNLIENGKVDSAEALTEYRKAATSLANRCIDLLRKEASKSAGKSIDWNKWGQKACAEICDGVRHLWSATWHSVNDRIGSKVDVKVPDVRAQRKRLEDEISKAVKERIEDIIATCRPGGGLKGEGPRKPKVGYVEDRRLWPSLSEAAERYDIPQGTLSKAVKSKRVNSHRVKRRVYVLAEDVRREAERLHSKNAVAWREKKRQEHPVAKHRADSEEEPE